MFLVVAVLADVVLSTATCGLEKGLSVRGLSAP